jgi:hypothetical protein
MRWGGRGPCLGAEKNRAREMLDAKRAARAKRSLQRPVRAALGEFEFVLLIFYCYYLC